MTTSRWTWIRWFLGVLLVLLVASVVRADETDTFTADGSSLLDSAAAPDQPNPDVPQPLLPLRVTARADWTIDQQVLLFVTVLSDSPAGTLQQAQLALELPEGVTIAPLPARTAQELGGAILVQPNTQSQIVPLAGTTGQQVVGLLRVPTDRPTTLRLTARATTATGPVQASLDVPIDPAAVRDGLWAIDATTEQLSDEGFPARSRMEWGVMP